MQNLHTPTLHRVLNTLPAAMDDALPLAIDFTAPLSQHHSSLSWRNVPAALELSEGVLRVRPGAGTDYWQRTFYTKDGAPMCNDNAPSYGLHVTGDFVATTRVRLQPAAQYDQAGLLCYENAASWAKAACEYIPGRSAKLGSVVTRGGYSDWATRPHPVTNGSVIDLEFKLHRSGASLLIFTRPGGAPDAEWWLARLAHLDASLDAPLWVAMYCCSPLGDGGIAEFSEFCVRRPSEGEAVLH